MNLLPIISVLIAAILGASGSLFMKFGAKKFSLNPKKLLKNKNIIIGILLHGLASIFYLAALKHERLSIIFPIGATQYIWINFLAVRYLKEKMNMLKWSGIGLIIFGVVLISWGT